METKPKPKETTTKIQRRYVVSENTDISTRLIL